MIIKTGSNLSLYLSLSAHSPSLTFTLSPSLSHALSLSLTSSPFFPNPKLQNLHPKSISRPKELQIGVGDLPLHALLPGVPLIFIFFVQEKLVLGTQTCAGPIYLSRRF